MPRGLDHGFDPRVQGVARMRCDGKLIERYLNGEVGVCLNFHSSFPTINFKSRNLLFVFQNNRLGRPQVLNFSTDWFPHLRKYIQCQRANYVQLSKEWVMLIFATALALGSLKADDPLVIIPMLAISGVAFVLLCVWHKGKIIWRTLASLTLLSTLVFIGWRDIRKPVPVEQANPVPPPVAPVTTINQTATNSDCSNIVAKDARLKCEIAKAHEKSKP
jgi:hypothetical protein